MIAIVLFLALAFLPANLGERLSKSEKPTSKAGAAGPAAGVRAGAPGRRHALRDPPGAPPGLGADGDARLVGASTSAILWASFKAFGEAPPLAVCAQAYFVGLLANLLPLPGGIGGVDGGMIGALLAFGVDPGLAVVAVLVYRGFAFWLPTLPGAIAYLQLRRTVARWKEERAAGRRPETPAHVTI